jgi:hypothetical protein
LGRGSESEAPRFDHLHPRLDDHEDLFVVAMRIFNVIAESLSAVVSIRKSVHMAEQTEAIMMMMMTMTMIKIQSSFLRIYQPINSLQNCS